MCHTLRREPAVNGAGAVFEDPPHRTRAPPGPHAHRAAAQTAPLENQLPWAPVRLNPQRLASAAIGMVRHGANYTSQLASIVTGGSPIQPAHYFVGDAPGSEEAWRARAHEVRGTWWEHRST